MNIRDMIPEDSQAQELEDMRRGAAGDLPGPSYETRRMTKDGRTLSVWLTASFLADEAGHVYAMAVTQRIAQGRLGT